MRRAIIAALGGFALAGLQPLSARAAVISATFNQALTDTPVAVSFNGTGSFLFTSISTGYGPGAWVATTGGAQVTTMGGAVTDFFGGAAIDQTGELYGFSSVDPAQMIPYSAVDDFIGLQLTLADGVHYGYAEVNGPSLVTVGFESVAGASIAAGATGEGTGITIGDAPVTTPEPASIALLAAGVAMLGARRRGRMAA